MDISGIDSAFLKYQIILDGLSDRRERVMRMCREIVVRSKRMIFQLQRSTEQKNPKHEVARYGLQEMLDNNWLEIAEELGNGEYMYRFLPLCSAAMEEYIEATVFLHYLTTSTLLSLGSIQQRFVFARESKKLTIPVSVQDYIHAICDFSGEIMRATMIFDIYHVCDGLHDTCLFMQRLYANVKMLYLTNKNSKNKRKEFLSNLVKLERFFFMHALRSGLRFRYSGAPPLFVSVL